MKESKAIDSFRRQFFRTRLEKVRTHGIQVFDEAALLIHDPVKDRDVLVTDTYPLERPHGSIQHFMAGLKFLVAAKATNRRWQSDASASLWSVRSFLAANQF